MERALHAIQMVRTAAETATFLLLLLYVARYQLTGVRYSKFSLAVVQQLILMFRYLLGCPHQAMINKIKNDECAYI